MIITIIGSLSRKDEMNVIKKWGESLGHTVNSPAENYRDQLPLLVKQISWISAIKEAALIVAIPKIVKLNDDAGKTSYTLEFGESTSYELAIAQHFKIPVVYWPQLMNELTNQKFLKLGGKI